MADAETLLLPLYCPLVVDGVEGKASSGRRFKRENPADIREVATVATGRTSAGFSRLNCRPLEALPS